MSARPERGLDFTVDLPLHLIQALRLVQALGESSHRLRLPAAALPTFRYLDRFFPTAVEPLEEGHPPCAASPSITRRPGRPWASSPGR
ncbi:MAG: hypothetical protein P1V51_01405 [Deltaproteobacteria bacterium]|nr:hypothetical protein [Deltaproteobacteria bacterium]